MTGDERKLLNLYAAMNSAGRSALIEYAEFLAERHRVEHHSTEPLMIDRPQIESVVAAIKRLSKTYPMLDRQALLHETSSFMMQHMMQGRAAVEVIDDLEIYFRDQYEQYRLKGSHDSDH
jgi:hypothetical protein